MKVLLISLNFLTETLFLRVSFIAIIVIAFIVIIGIIKRWNSLFLGVITFAQFVAAVISILQIYPNIGRLGDKFTGKWTVRNKYLITQKLSDGTRKALDPVEGIGEQYILYNPKTKTFDGLGWIAMGDDAEQPSQAIKDTTEDIVTFAIENGMFSPVKESTITFQTRSLHKTLRNRINTHEQAVCYAEFPLPPEDETQEWIGKASCSTDSFDVQIIDVILSKEE